MKPKNDLLMLSLDSATRRRSVALSRGSRLIAVHSSEVSSPSSANSLHEIDQALSQASINLSDVDVYAVTIGPGSFTSLRAGLSTFKAFAATLKKPLVGIQTLHAVAHAAKPGQRIQAFIPVGRGEVFTQNLNVSQKGELSEHEAPRHLSLETLIEECLRLGGGVKWAGNMSELFYSSIKMGAQMAGIKLVDQTSGQTQPADDEWMIACPVEILAPSVAALAYLKYVPELTVHASQIHALYVRESESEFKTHVTRKD